MAPEAPRAQQRRWLMVVAGTVGLLAAVVALGEWSAWPFLAGPLERMLSSSLDRGVRLSAPADAALATPARAFGIRFLGGVQLQTSQLDIAAPAWSSAPHLLLARDVDLRLVAPPAPRDRTVRQNHSRQVGVCRSVRVGGISTRC